MKHIIKILFFLTNVLNEMIFKYSFYFFQLINKFKSKIDQILLL